LTNVKVSKKGIDPTSSSNKLDASTLDLAAGSDRVYVDGLPDSGAGAVEGVTTTITCSYLSDSPPTAGETITYAGDDYKCTEAEIEYAVGELVKGTATYVSIPSE
jgi:hypothetical protein